MKKVTNLECIEIFNTINNLELKEETKFRYAAIKVFTATKKLVDKYQEKLQEINVDTCFTNEKGVIEKDDKGNFLFTREGARERDKLVKELNSEMVEIPHHFVELTSELKSQLNPYTIELLKGVVFEE